MHLHIGPPRPARVRLFFKIPSSIIPDDSTMHGQPLLAYVEWFKPFTPSSQDSATGLYRTAPAVDRNHVREACIIPANAIVRSCHLLPSYGKRSNHWWSSSNVLDNCDKFLLNTYLDVYTFSSMLGKPMG